MTTKFTMSRDVNGYNAFGVVPSDTKYSATLTISTDTSLTVPGGMGLGGNGFYGNSRWLAIFNFTPGASVWFANNATAAVPVGASFASTTSELNPAAREVAGGDVLHFICGSANVSVSVAFYSLS